MSRRQQAADGDIGGAGGGARWAQLRTRTLSTPEGTRHYEAGNRQARSYRQTMQVLNALRSRLGVTQQELAVRMHRSQPTVARLLTRVDNPTLTSVGEVLQGLGMRGRLVIEEAPPGEDDALVIEVHVPSTGTRAQPAPRSRRARKTVAGTHDAPGEGALRI